MQPRKLNVGFAFFNYGSNGGCASEHPNIRQWIVPLYHKLKSEDRIDQIWTADFSDTPITMTRNGAVEWAKAYKIDVLVMIDSDQAPDLYLGFAADAKPFFESSFDFLYGHWDKGPVAIFAPYCGPPAHPVKGGAEIPYASHWVNYHSEINPRNFKMDLYSRAEAAVMGGIQEAAAGPTGVCMIDMRCFDLISHPYFDYEYEGETKCCGTCGQKIPGPRAQKASTEDMYFFRNLSLNGCIKLGYNTVFCNWDAWAGHWKPLCVGKPQNLTADRVAHVLKEAVIENQKEGLKQQMVRRNPSLPIHPAQRARGVPFISLEAMELAKEKTVIPLKAGVPTFEEADRMTPADDLATLSFLVARESVRLRRRKNPMVVVELGSWTGRSALAMQAAMEPGSHFEIHCVDHFKGTGTDWTRAIAESATEFDAVYKRFLENVGDSKDVTIFPHRMHSLDMSKRWAQYEKPIDLLFVDAGHSYDECKADILAWRDYVADGGIISGHDWNELFPGVKQAVTEIFGEVNVVGNVWSVRRSAINSIPNDLKRTSFAEHQRSANLEFEAMYFAIDTPSLNETDDVAQMPVDASANGQDHESL